MLVRHRGSCLCSQHGLPHSLNSASLSRVHKRVNAGPVKGLVKGEVRPSKGDKPTHLKTSSALPKPRTPCLASCTPVPAVRGALACPQQRKHPGLGGEAAPHDNTSSFARRTAPYRLRWGPRARTAVGLLELRPREWPTFGERFQSPQLPHDFICEAPGTAQTHTEHKGESTGRPAQPQPGPHAAPAQVL